MRTQISTTMPDTIAANLDSYLDYLIRPMLWILEALEEVQGDWYRNTIEIKVSRKHTTDLLNLDDKYIDINMSRGLWSGFPAVYNSNTTEGIIVTTPKNKNSL